jgi:hypothetical protein
MVFWWMNTVKILGAEEFDMELKVNMIKLRRMLCEQGM